MSLFSKIAHKQNGNYGRLKHHTVLKRQTEIGRVTSRTESMDRDGVKNALTAPSQ